MNFYSQAGQDKWVLEIMEHKKSPKFFVDIGAYDGVNTSNTFALEQQGWTGACIEASPEVFQALIVNRPNCKNLNVAAASFEGEINFSGFSSTSDKNAPLVPCSKLETILELAKAPYEIDYMSMDIEGMEPDVLLSFDFSKYQINTATIEHNLYMDGPVNKNLIFKIMSNNGFERVVEDAPCLDTNPLYYMKPYEDWYVNKKIL